MKLLFLILLLIYKFIFSMDTTTQSKSVGYHMPVLIYSSNALTPVISQATVELHFDKHLRAYIDNYNRLVKDSRFENMTLREVVIKAPEGPLLNNAGQVLNHVLYFEQFTPYPPKENRPSKALAAAIDFDFGSFDNFRKMMEDAATSLFGSGWVWLAQEPSGRLVVLSCKNGDNPVRHNMVPLLGIDVWEHAYYLDYQNRRAEHVHRLWDIVDWEMVQSRMLQ